MGEPGLVAVGDYGEVLFSPEGTTWTAVLSGTTVFLRDVIWTGEEFFAVGDDGVVVRSGDGLTWSAPQTSTDADFTCVTFAGGVFVAGGPEDTLLASDDGENWTRHQVGWGDSRATDIEWADGQFVAVGSSLSAVSPDGHDWFLAPYFVFEDCYGVSLVWTGSMLVALADGFVWTSLDGIDWAFAENPLYQLWADGLAWTGNAFVATGEYAWLSTDLSSWVQVEDPFGEDPVWASSIAWTGRQLVAVGGADMVAVSPDGISWETVQVAGNERVRFSAIAEGNSRLVSVSWAGGQGLSMDGIRWELIPETAGFMDVVHGGGQFVAVGPWGRTGTSLDGVDWRVSSSGAHSLHGVTWTGTHYVAVSSHHGEIITSEDGQSWVVEDESSADDLEAVYAQDGAVVAVGSSSACGGPWSPLVVVGQPGGPWRRDWSFCATGLEGYDLNDVSFGAGRWIVVGSDGLVLTSTDLQEWHVVDVVTDQSLGSVSWSGGEFLVTGGDGVALSSADGLTWQGEDLPTGVYLKDSEWWDDAWYVVGSLGVIIRGACDWPDLPPVAGFGVVADEWAPDALVRFEDETTGYATSWSWRFGDGVESSATSPSHRFSTVGSHTVSQTVCNEVGCDTAVAKVEISIQPPRAQLSWMGPQLLLDTEVAWRDLSSGPPAQWTWSLGDGTYSVLPDPRHRYVAPGIYRVELDVSNPAGQDSAVVQVVVGPPAIVATCVESRFRDIAWNGSTLLAVTHDSAWTSQDGLSWTDHDLPYGFHPDGLAWTGEVFVAAGHDAVATSEDGESWAAGPVPVNGLRDVAGNGSLTVAVGDDGAVIVSYDLVDWWLGESGTTADLMHIAVHDELFVVTGSRNQRELLESTNGFTWVTAAGDYGTAGAVAHGELGFAVATKTGVFRRGDDAVWIRVDTAVEGSASPGIDGLAVARGQLLTTSVSPDRTLRWFAPPLGHWVEIPHSGGSTMVTTEDAVLVLEGNNIRRLPVHPNPAPPVIFTDGFETGDTGAWSQVGQ